jgi:hypothetical protein
MSSVYYCGKPLSKARYNPAGFQFQVCRRCPQKLIMLNSVPAKKEIKGSRK